MRFRILILTVFTTLALAGPGVAQTAEDEPNDGVRDATGPLDGGADYTGALSGPADRDWFVLYTTGTEFDVVFTNTTQSGCGSMRVQLSDADADAIQSFGSEPGDDPKHVPQSSSQPERYYLLVDSEGGCRATYTLRVEPAAALTSERPPGVTGPPPCQDARDRLGVAQRALRRAKRSGGARRVRAAKRAVTRARRRLAAAC